MEKRYDVVIYNYSTRIVYSVIGRNMREDRADRREMTGLSKCNSDYGTMAIELKPTQKEIQKGDNVKDF